MRRPILWNLLALFIGVCLLVAALVVAMRPSRTNAVVDHPDPIATTKFIDLTDASIEWSPGWRVTDDGATPPEPSDPATMPSGWLRFEYAGDELTLVVDQGDYWAYLYVTVDGEPANLLPPSMGHEPVVAPAAGYLPLYRPEIAEPSEEWIAVHRSGNPDATHEVEITLWRGWGEVPLRRIIVDNPYPPRGSGSSEALLLVLAVWCLAVPAWSAIRLFVRVSGDVAIFRRWSVALLSPRAQTVATAVGAVAFVLGILLGGFGWQVVAPCVAVLAIASAVRPSLWYGALLFALPFYYSFPLPLLPNRAVGLIDVGVWVGVIAAALHALLAITASRSNSTAAKDAGPSDVTGNYESAASISKWGLFLLAVIASWAFVSAAGAEYASIALREWRTVFLAALVVATGLTLTLRFAERVGREVAILVGGWLLGATIFAALALWLYPDPSVIIPAEGVQRLRGFYGSPNNLALYLERSLAVTLALLLFMGGWRLRLVAGIAALVQLAAFLLTFSKGGLFLALPVMGVVLWGAGFYALRRERRSTRVLWALAGVAAVVVLATLPFLGTERFARIVDLGSGTGFLRVNLWRAAWQMALDHPWLGVGPDGFLYAYRSQYIFPQAWMEPNLNHPHNWLLDWWTRMGIPGLLLGLAFWGLIVWNCIQNLRKRWGWVALNVGILAATAAALAHGLIDLSYALPDLMIVWALFAVLTSLRVQRQTA